MNILLKLAMSSYIFLYRISRGRIGGRMAGLKVLLLTTTGRKTGQPRTTPLSYFTQDGNFVIIASNGGADRHPAWFFNLQSNPEVTLQLAATTVAAQAEVVDPQQRAKLWRDLIKLAPAYARYATRTKREIPLVILRPVA